MFLVEYNLKPGDPGYGTGHINLGAMGEFSFPENPAYDGRRIVEVPTEAVQKKILGNNPHGQQIFVIPNDLVSSKDRALIKEVVLEVLAEQKRPRGRPRKVEDEE